MLVLELKLMYDGYSDNIRARKDCFYNNQGVPYPECITPFHRISILKVMVDGKVMVARVMTHYDKLFSYHNIDTLKEEAYNYLLRKVITAISNDLDVSCKNKLGEKIDTNI